MIIHENKIYCRWTFGWDLLTVATSSFTKAFIQIKWVETGGNRLKTHQLVVALFLDIFHTTQTSRQSRQLQRTKLLTVSFSACRILMRRRCHGKHQQLSRQEKTLLFCRPPWKPPHTHTHTHTRKTRLKANIWLLCVGKPESEARRWGFRRSPWAPCEPELSCRAPWCCCCQSSELRHSLWWRLCTASLTGNTAPC